MKKLLSTTIAAGILATASFGSCALADVTASTLPKFNHADGAKVTQDNLDMNVQVQGGNGALGSVYWDNFNVGKDARVNFEFTNHNQTALNVVDQAGGLSQIYGRLTSSGCEGCGYAGTGKVILLNPNGVLFGDGANVNLNSFTVSTFDGKYNKDDNTLVLDRNGKTSPNGIVVTDGATIYGDKAVNFISDKVNLYKGSQISTNLGKNFNLEDTASMGKVKIVTADGVTFTYYDKGAVKKVSDFKASKDQMNIQVNGSIEAGNIDIRNYSSNSASDINVNDGATLKATKAVSGNDGSIYLTSSNDIIVRGSKLETVNAEGAENAKGGDIELLAGHKIGIASSDIKAVGNITATSQNYDVVVDGSTITTDKDVAIKAKNYASVQKLESKGSSIKGNNVTVDGGIAQVVSSDIDAKGDIKVNGGRVWTHDANLTSAKDITIAASTGDVQSTGTTKTYAKNGKLNITAANDVKGKFDVKDTLTTIKAGKDINVNLANIDNREKGLTAEAEQNVTVATDGTLSISRLVAKKGGKPYTKEEKIPGDNSERSYIYVEHGKFTSEMTDDDYTVTASDTPINGGKDNLRHHIQYGNGQEKILLINPRPAEKADETQQATAQLNINDDQASMLNKLPRQPESIKANNDIKDGRTSFVDVFAAASQIEVVDDDEDEE